MWTQQGARAISANGQQTPSLDRQILALAVPALGALVAEPLFILVDSAVVGHLGTDALAGLALASSVLLSVVGLCVFLAYATTASVARRLGAGDRAGSLQVGIDGMWLAAGLGVVLAVALWVAAPWVVAVMGADDETARQAVTYLRWSAPGLVGMLLVLAATGTLRGLQDTRTPLGVAVTGAVVNTALNVALVWGLGLGIAGSGGGTALTQLGMAAVLVVVVVRGAREAGSSLRPAAGGIWTSARHGAPLLARTATLRGAILLTTWVATGLGAVTLAGHQVVSSVWGLAAFALDALAIAAQALVGHALGAGDVPRTRGVLRRTLQWGVGAGVILGVVLGGAAALYAPLFTPDDEVRHAIVVGMLVAGVCMPLAGWVFVLDGVLIGAGDGRFLAWAGLMTLVVYLPFALAVRAYAPPGAEGLLWLTAAFSGVFMLARALTTGYRARGTAWMVTGT
ncbi:MATE family efflux transporter [Cellulomonas palmilytica]|uniref:MATE family efflux transporter n=1 Tax=Cellulomonas palmilytica TaxID=2608402 RepID=UPI001F378CFC|nr:MATE family efflux transporter [Cellulomonas palmilytica]UJP40581.1 MATE family efflux transporter [Cellulomonas palmilytica]